MTKELKLKQIGQNLILTLENETLTGKFAEKEERTRIKECVAHYLKKPTKKGLAEILLNFKKIKTESITETIKTKKENIIKEDNDIANLKLRIDAIEKLLERYAPAPEPAHRNIRTGEY